MGVKYLWDTNTAIYFLHQQLPIAAEKFIDDLLIQELPCISVITEIELLCWKTSKPSDLQVLQNFINDSRIIELEPSIKYETASIRKELRIKLPDAIIAATAIVYELTLITRNTSDFKNITRLKTVDVYKL